MPITMTDPDALRLLAMTADILGLPEPPPPKKREIGIKAPEGMSGGTEELK
jgi:hypothetical protein